MKDIRLTDGTLLEININFLTLKLIVDLDVEKLHTKLQKKPDEKKIQMDIASKLLYAIIRSNGRKVDMDEALMLLPVEDETIQSLIIEFSSKLENFKKKQENKM